jgi:hypothetical protein
LTGGARKQQPNETRPGIAGSPLTLTSTSLAQEGPETILTVTLSGDFPGSPLAMRFHFTIRGDKIATLTIRG